MSEGLVEISTVFFFVAFVFAAGSAWSGVHRENGSTYYLLDRARVFIFGMVVCVMVAIVRTAVRKSATVAAG